MPRCVLCILTILGIARMGWADDGPHVNCIGMKLIRIEPGSFTMGSLAGGDFDERPVHKVTISKPFFLAATEVTNAQYEQFDPEHKRLRGKLGFSREDDEAVVFVSWHDAVKFCDWLSQKEGKAYRLPTEAEWEYACRAGSTTAYHTGDVLPKEFHKNVKESWFPSSRGEGEVVPLYVGRTPASPWGLYDMHGNVEEWCHDWYGPYAEGEQTDPVGRKHGDFRVTRGGSHSTTLEFLRCGNRLGTLPEDKSWLIGFRVVQAEMPKTTPLAAVTPPPNQQDVSQEIPPDLAKGPDPRKPYFKGPRTYVKIPPDSNGPMFSRHNHDPALVECPNGDLLAIWYSCRREPGRELCVLASRLRCGAEEWEPASPFWDAPDRNDHAPAMWADGKGTIYHFNGLSAAATWGNAAVIMRVSTDSGATWSKARLIRPEHGTRRQPVESVFRTREGHILLPCDAVVGGRGGTAIHLSSQRDRSWHDPGGTILGIHAPVVQLRDGRLMAFGRGDTIDGRMPKSISDDLGKTWTYSASPFPPLGGGQRAVLLRLREGPILLVSFAKKITITDASGRQRPVSGLFAALSLDEGETWSVKRLISDDGPPRTIDGGGNTGKFTISMHSAEPRGYMSICQTPDDVIHLISSKQHYAFNLTWLSTPAPALFGTTGLERMKYNHPGLVVDLGVGLWAWPLPMDYDGDGDHDLVVSCPDVPHNGTYFFENTSGDVKFPVFEPGKRIAKGFRDIQASNVEGKVRVLTPGHEYPDVPTNRFGSPVKLPVSAKVHQTKGNISPDQWKLADYDGDGRFDLIVGIGDWVDYGWEDAFNAQGQWTRGPQHGFVYLLRNRGTSDNPAYQRPVKIEAGGRPIDVYGTPSPNLADFDGDGDLDIICGEFLDKFTYFQNVGTRTSPKYAAGRYLSHDDEPLRMDLCMIVPSAIDWDKDGDVDLVVGDEDGRVALVENSGEVVAGMPRFLPPKYFRQRATDVKFGALTTPVSFDWDGDGDEDLFSGNTAGHIGWIENLDGGNPPKWAPPRYLKADGRVIRIQAGYNGSIQGPCEAKWGYTTLDVADWDHDGLPDIVANSIWGKVHWYRNVGTRKAPKLAAAQPVEVEWPGKPPKLAWNWWDPQGKELVTQWRTTPVVIDWTSDGLSDLVMLDHEGYLALFERVKRDGRLLLLPPKRIFIDENGRPLRLNSRTAGKSGRRKLCLADWDGDGRIDLLANGQNVDFLRNMGDRNGRTVLKNMGPVGSRRLAGHSTSPSVVDWDKDGRPDLLVGAEDGFLYHLKNRGAKGTGGAAPQPTD